MGFPNLKSYYYAALLTSVINAHTTKQPPQWVVLENQLCTNNDLSSTLWTPKHERPRTTDMLPTTKLLLSTWDNCREKLCSAHPWALAAPIKTLHHCNGTFPHQKWEERGITHMYPLYTSEGLIHFPDLQTEFSLPSNFTFAYLQLKALLKDNSIHNRRQTLRTTVTKFEMQCMSATTPKKVLSTCYDSLANLKTDDTWKFMNDWQEDL
ncbi:Hypothetical predicted protein [Pelobates cultripes]|uniref:Uncharacterized protein n=1 Tax=Pelobates cultripes TaxID=61616 RepID=A0AAD1T0G0_PELCU|nr:Hypothetical predicted protein [Pelobates cultripes]